MGAASFSAHNTARPTSASVINESAVNNIHRLFALVNIEARESEAGVPLNDSNVQTVVESKDLSAASVRLRFPWDVVIDEMPHTLPDRGVHDGWLALRSTLVLAGARVEFDFVGVVSQEPHLSFDVVSPAEVGSGGLAVCRIIRSAIR